MFIANLLPNSCYLINVIILSKEHIIFFVSPVKNLSIPNEKIRVKLLFYNCGSASWLAWYGMTKGSKPREDNVLLVSVLWVLWQPLITMTNDLTNK